MVPDLTILAERDRQQSNLNLQTSAFEMRLLQWTWVSTLCIPYHSVFRT